MSSELQHTSSQSSWTEVPTCLTQLQGRNGWMEFPHWVWNLTSPMFSHGCYLQFKQLLTNIQQYSITNSINTWKTTVTATICDQISLLKIVYLLNTLHKTGAYFYRYLPCWYSTNKYFNWPTYGHQRHVFLSPQALHQLLKLSQTTSDLDEKCAYTYVRWTSRAPFLRGEQK